MQLRKKISRIWPAIVESEPATDLQLSIEVRLWAAQKKLSVAHGSAHLSFAKVKQQGMWAVRSVVHIKHANRRTVSKNAMETMTVIREIEAALIFVDSCSVVQERGRTTIDIVKYLQPTTG